MQHFWVMAYKIPNCFCQNMTCCFWRIVQLQRHAADQTVRHPTFLSLLLGTGKSSKLHLLPFHMTRQQDWSCSWVNEVIIKQSKLVPTVKWFLRNRVPRLFNLTSRVFFQFTLQKSLGLVTCRHVTSFLHIQSTAVVVPLFSLNHCHSWREFQLQVYPKPCAASDLFILNKHQ